MLCPLKALAPWLIDSNRKASGAHCQFHLLYHDSVLPQITQLLTGKDYDADKMSMQEQREGKMDAAKTVLVCLKVCVSTSLQGISSEASQQRGEWIHSRNLVNFALHRQTSLSTHTLNTPDGFMANLFIMLGTLWVPVSGKCVWSDGKEWFWLRENNK